jgi:hypothetical protein
MLKSTPRRKREAMVGRSLVGVVQPRAAHARRAMRLGVFTACMRFLWQSTDGEDVCSLCGKGRKPGEDFRVVRNVHVHWARVLELSCPRPFLSEWTSRKQYYSNVPDIKLEKHFKCFTHEQLANAFSSCNSGKQCHKHCLHAFNFCVKVKFDVFLKETGYTGPKPDVRFCTLCTIV